MEASVLQKMFSWCARHPARAGSLAGLFQQACTIGIAVILIPVTTSFLRPEEAGLWFAFQGLVAMISMVDLGFGFAISRQTAFTFGKSDEVKATGDFIELGSGSLGIHRLFILTRKLYAILSALGVILALLAYEIFSRVGNLIPEGISGARMGWYGVAFAAIILIFTGGYASFLNGLGAVYQTRLAAGLYQLAAGIGAGIAAWLGGGLALMSASFAVCSVIYLIAVSGLLRKLIPRLENGDPPEPPDGSLRLLARAALPVGTVNVFSSLVYMAQPPLLGILVGPEKIVPFLLGSENWTRVQYDVHANRPTPTSFLYPPPCTSGPPRGPSKHEADDRQNHHPGRRHQHHLLCRKSVDGRRPFA